MPLKLSPRSRNVGCCASSQSAFEARLAHHDISLRCITIFDGATCRLAKLMAAVSGLEQSLSQLLDRLPRLQQDTALQQACGTQVSLIAFLAIICLHRSAVFDSPMPSVSSKQRQHQRLLPAPVCLCSTVASHLSRVSHRMLPSCWRRGRSCYWTPAPPSQQLDA